MPDYLKIAEDFLEKGMYFKAIEFAEKTIFEGQNNSKGFEILGLANYRAKNIKLSIEYLEKSIEANPKNANSLYNLGLVYVYLADWDKALDNTNKALLNNTNNLNYLYQLAIIYKRTNKVNDSIEICSKILDLSPGDQSTLSLRAGIYLKNGAYELAINDFMKLDQKTNDKGMIYNNIGFCYSKLGDFRRAKTNLQFALEFKPSMAYAHNNLGFVYYLENNYNKALEYINESLRIDSSNSYALKNRAIVFIALNKTEQAIRDLELAKELGYSKLYDNEVDELLEKYNKNGG